MADIHQQALATRTAFLLHSADYSDLVITCKDHEFKVHRNIVLPASKVLATACSGTYKEGTGGPIDLSEDDPNAVKRMLQYLYTGNYDDADHEADEGVPGSSRMAPGNTRPSSTQLDADQLSETSSIASDALEKAAKAPIHVKVSTLTNNLLVYALADIHDIPLLKSLAQTKFEVRAADEWATGDIIRLLPQVYATTPDTDRGLRQVMIGVCLRSMEQLMCHKHFRTLLKGDAAMCFDVLDAVQMWREERDIHEPRVVKAPDDAKLKRVIEWTKTQERVFKSIVESNASCPTCLRALHLSVSNGATTDWHGPLIVKCRQCRARFTAD
ncbi:MAG: hypothetical protein LQ339_002125 [Xanthoria mediterranea]|nr:MAG: hypothetical protein LQ339_002125 [Xanthoria mediterranea]